MLQFGFLGLCLWWLFVGALADKVELPNSVFIGLLLLGLFVFFARLGGVKGAILWVLGIVVAWYLEWHYWP